MSLSKLNAGGRPKTSGVWEYFKFNIDTGYSECVVDVGTKLCGKKFSGRNPTNLKTHLSSFHKESFAALTTKENAIKLDREVKASSNRSHSSSSSVSSSNSIKDFMVKPTTYAKNSEQHRIRARGLAKLVAESGVSTMLPTAVAFKEFCKVMDPKFAVPGMLAFKYWRIWLGLC
jgi:hypothetical protein